MTSAPFTSAVEAALSYKARGWSPIFFPRSTKYPSQTNWQDLRLTEAEIRRQSADTNVGVILGPASGGLTDVDLDQALAVSLARHFLPNTGAVFGRASKPASHWLYNTDLAERVPQAALQFKDPDTNAMLVELRIGGGGKAAQTMFPGSVHPPTGEPVTWMGDGEPARVNSEDLVKAVQKIAAAAVLAARWAAPGGQHDDQLTLLSLLARSGWGEDEAVAFACAVIGAAGGDPDPHKRRQTFADAQQRLKDGEKLRGWPTFKSRFGRKVAERVAEWLGLSPTSEDEADPEAWASPDLSFLGTGRRPAPEFPLDLLGPFWSEWVSSRAKAASAPVDYVAMGLLACASAAIANVRWPLAGASWSEPPILWCTIVGPPSSSKTPALKAAFALLQQAEDRMALGFDEQMTAYKTRAVFAAAKHAAWKEEVAKAVKHGDPAPPMPADAEEPEAPVQPRIKVADATIEKLAALAASLPRGLLLVRDELAGWLGGFDRYGGAGADRAFALEMYNGGPYTVDRMKNPVPLRIRHLSIGVLGGIQPDKLSGIIDGMDDGLAGRFLWSWADVIPTFTLARTRLDDREAQEAFARLATLQMNVDEHGNLEPRQVRLSHPAEDALEAFGREIASRAHESEGAFAGLLGKARGHALRLAAVLDYLRWAAIPQAGEPTMISQEAVLAAAGLLDGYFLPMADRVFGDAVVPLSERRARVLARYLRKSGLEQFKARDVYREINGLVREPAAMDAACSALVEAGLIRPQFTRAGDQPGRKAKVYEVNPVLLRRAA